MPAPGLPSETIRKLWGSLYVCFVFALFADELLKEIPFPMNDTRVMDPFSFQNWLDDHREEVERKKSLRLFGDNFETEVKVFCYFIEIEGRFSFK